MGKVKKCKNDGKEKKWVILLPLVWAGSLGSVVFHFLSNRGFRVPVIPLGGSSHSGPGSACQALLASEASRGQPMVLEAVRKGPFSDAVSGEMTGIIFVCKIVSKSSQSPCPNSSAILSLFRGEKPNG